MREVVVGQARTDDRHGFVAVDVWFRVAIPADDDPTTPRPGRRAQYAAEQATYVPQAPGDYTAPIQVTNPDGTVTQTGGGANWNEVVAFRNGEYTELPPISVPIDPAWHNADVAAALSSASLNVNGDILTWLHSDRVTKVLAADDRRYGLLGTSFSNGTWSPGKA